MDTVGMIEAGMQADVQRLQVISQNLANLSTTGFKKEIAVTRGFSDFLPGDPSVSAVQASRSVRPAVSTTTDHAAGALKFSGNPLDLAIEGDGYFVVSTPQGQAFTRQGTLQLDASGRLVTASGLPVMGQSGEIRLNGPTPRVDGQGNVYDGNQLVDQLKVVRVSDPSALSRVGNGLFMSEAPTLAADATQYRVRQGFSEASNVVSMQEMIRLIETVRHFEASQKIARGYDDMLDRALSNLGQL